ncbi:hypothetical protein BDY21DRAFT_354836 [Lineolata rhizophorae]|uniref:Uncharacterized protein n=1 Tax=Lineolata rhizophorae TaxID=578093 RepID=A0A6A6NPK1_9PEZI|nr:hypothetical protein BDY21DRAFT_354836 [Lineolata rhizophorae]
MLMVMTCRFALRQRMSPLSLGRFSFTLLWLLLLAWQYYYFLGSADGGFVSSALALACAVCPFCFSRIRRGKGTEVIQFTRFTIRLQLRNLAKSCGSAQQMRRSSGSIVILRRDGAMA